MLCVESKRRGCHCILCLWDVFGKDVLVHVLMGGWEVGFATCICRGCAGSMVGCGPGGSFGSVAMAPEISPGCDKCDRLVLALVESKFGELFPGWRGPCKCPRVGRADNRPHHSQKFVCE